MTAPAPSRSKLSLRKRIGFSAAIVVATVLAAELGGAVVYWFVRGTPFSYASLQEQRSSAIAQIGSTQGIIGQVHPYVGFVEQPRAESDVTPFGRSKPTPISTYGYYDDAPPLHKRAPGKAIVGIVGGSVACFFAVNGTDRLRADLANVPGFVGKEIVFVNLAMGGYKQPQQLMTLSYLLSLGAEFDVVLNIDGFNEIALYEFENAGNRIFPAFPRSWHARIEVANPRRGRLLGKIEYLNSRRADSARRFSSIPWRWSAVANVLWDALDRRARAEIFDLQKEGTRDLGADYNRYAVTGPKIEFSDTRALYDHLVALWKNSSIQLDYLCRSNGIRYEHFLQANQYDDDSKPMGSEERTVAYLDKHPYHRAVDLGYPLLVAAGRDLAKRGIAFHDLTRIFADHPEPIYIDGCCHYNKAGYEIMADHIAKAVRADVSNATMMKD